MASIGSKPPALTSPAVAITMLCLLGAFLMHDSHATHRWIKFGIFSFQPSEIAKPTLVLFLAWFLQDRMQEIEDWRNTLLPAALPSLLFIVLILKEPDLVWLATSEEKMTHVSAFTAIPKDSLPQMTTDAKTRKDAFAGSVTHPRHPHFQQLGRFRRIKQRFGQRQSPRISPDKHSRSHLP